MITVTTTDFMTMIIPVARIVYIGMLDKDDPTQTYLKLDDGSRIATEESPDKLEAKVLATRTATVLGGLTPLQWMTGMVASGKTHGTDADSAAVKILDSIDQDCE